MEFVLIDLERTIESGMTHYWKQNLHGYTRSTTEAGRFSIGQAKQEVEQDKDKYTIAIPVDRFNKLVPKIDLI